MTLAIVLPLPAMVGLTVTPLLDGLGSSRINVAVPGILALCAMSTAFTGPGHLHRLRPPLRRRRFLSTTPLGRTGLIAGKVLAVLAVLFLQVLIVDGRGPASAGSPTPRAGSPAWSSWCSGPHAFTALGLLVAGTVRPEATLAITNLLWILLGALGGIVIPSERLPGAGAGRRALPPLRLAGPGAEGCVPVRQRQRRCGLVLLLGRRSPAARQPVGSSGIEKTVSTASRTPRIVFQNHLPVPSG